MSAIFVPKPLILFNTFGGQCQDFHLWADLRKRFLGFSLHCGGKCNRHEARVLPIIEAIRKTGATSLRAIAAELTSRKVETVRGGAWSAMQVSNIMKRTAE